MSNMNIVTETAAEVIETLYLFRKFGFLKFLSLSQKS